MHRWSIALFRLFGIELEVHATFLLLLAFFAWQGWSWAAWRGATWAVVFVVLVFVCVVLHELGHSLVARRFGIRVPRILLLPIGGMAQFERIPREPGREFAIAIAGPAVSWTIAAGLYAGTGWAAPLLGVPEYAFELPGCLLTANLVLGIFNLLPAFPMDGGRMFRALLATKLPYLKATWWAARIGQGIALLGIVAALAPGLWGEPMQPPLWMPALLFTFIAIGADMELTAVRKQELYLGLTVRDVLRRDFAALPAEAPLGAALALLARTHPQDLLLLTNGVPTAILRRERLAKALRASPDTAGCLPHADHEFATMQADWPLFPAALDLLRGEQVLFPVYEHGVFAGVVDARHLDAMARLQKRVAARE